MTNSSALLRTTLKSTLLLGLSPSVAAAQNADLVPQRAELTKIGQALSQVEVKAKKVNEKLGYGFNEGRCLFGVKLPSGGEANEKFFLRAGQSYVFIGGGDKTARNVDLQLRDSAGRVMSQDIEPDAAPFLLVKPKVSGIYTLTLVLKSGWKGPAFGALTVLRKGGIAVPMGRIVEAAIRMDYASYAIFEKYGGGHFNESPGTWALYGAVVGQGQVLSSGTRTYHATNLGVITAGDGSVYSLGSGLSDQNNGVFLTGIPAGAAPKIINQVKAGAYLVTVANKRSSGPALVMAVLLDLPVAAPKVDSPVALDVPQHSPFIGDWKGDWTNDNNEHSGSFKLQVDHDGALSGKLNCPDLKVNAKVKGGVSLDGTFYLSFIQAKQDAEAEGTLKFSSNDHKELTGKLKFSSDGKLLGSAAFSLTR